MILRKSPSPFLHALRTMSSDQLPALREKKLSSQSQKRLEDAVLARIAEEENRTVFDQSALRSPASEPIFLPDDEATPVIEVIGAVSWKKTLSSVLAACLCFAVLITAVLFRGDIAHYLAEHGWTTEHTVVTEHADTQAIFKEPSETGVAPPSEDAEGFALHVTNVETYVGHLVLSLQLTSDVPLEGITVQYSRVILSRWNDETKQHETLYDVYTSDRPKLDVLAGVLHFPLTAAGQTSSVTADLTVTRDLRGADGLYFVTLEGLTLVRDTGDTNAENAEDALIAETLTDGAVHGRFVIFPDELSNAMQDETLPPRDTVTPPSESVYPQGLLGVSEKYALTLTNTAVEDDTVTLEMRLDSLQTMPVGWAVYFKTCEIDLWNHEKQVWEGKFGMGYDGVGFEKMLMAGDLHFLSDHEAGTVTASMPYYLPDDGWFRITLRGLVLVREAQENEEAQWNLVTEVLDENAVYAVFYKD